MRVRDLKEYRLREGQRYSLTAPVYDPERPSLAVRRLSSTARSSVAQPSITRFSGHPAPLRPVYGRLLAAHSGGASRAAAHAETASGVPVWRARRACPYGGVRRQTLHPCQCDAHC